MKPHETLYSKSKEFARALAFWKGTCLIRWKSKILGKNKLKFKNVKFSINFDWNVPRSKIIRFQWNVVKPFIWKPKNPARLSHFEKGPVWYVENWKSNFFEQVQVDPRELTLRVAVRFLERRALRTKCIFSQYFLHFCKKMSTRSRTSVEFFGLRTNKRFYKVSLIFDDF